MTQSHARSVSSSYLELMNIDPDDLIDTSNVAKILGLANRTSVSVYQRRYPAMPRPVVDLGRGRTKLWSRKAVASWALSADLRSPQAICTAELAQLGRQGEPLAQNVSERIHVGTPARPRRRQQTAASRPFKAICISASPGPGPSGRSGLPSRDA